MTTAYIEPSHCLLHGGHSFQSILFDVLFVAIFSPFPCGHPALISWANGMAPPTQIGCHWYLAAVNCPLISCHWYHQAAVQCPLNVYHWYLAAVKCPLIGYYWYLAALKMPSDWLLIVPGGCKMPFDWL